MTDRVQRGAWILADYAARYYPGAEDTEDEDGAYTVATDIVADLLHTVAATGHPSPEGILDVAALHFQEEQQTDEREN